MFSSFAAFLGRLDSIYQSQSHFVALKARLLAAFNLVVLVFIPVNIAKLFWIRPPALPFRFTFNLIFLLAAILSLAWVKKGRMDLAGNGLVLFMILPIYGLLLFVPNYAEPLSTAYQMFIFDLVCLLLALVFASRKVLLAVLAVILASHFWFYSAELHSETIPGTLKFAADTLFRDGIFALGFVFCLGITLTILAEAAHRHSEESLLALRALNENLGHLVSERTRELEAETRRANDASRAKGDFLANMSHEIRTPLNGIIASSDLLLNRRDLPPEAFETVRLISETGELLLKQVGDVLDFSKIESGQLDLETHPFNLPQLAGDVVALLDAKASLEGVQVHFTVQPELSRSFQGDSFRLRQILLNLVSNAIKFTPSGAGVRLIVASDDPLADPVLIRFEVRDTGIGIEESALKRIFERFTQADSSTSRRYGGTGLGLAISSRLVGLMGGRLEAESVPGQGSAFHFAVPFRPLDAGTALPAPLSSEPELPSLGLHVLVAEDNVINRKLLASQLEKLGCRHTLVADGEELLAALQQPPLPDLVMTDCEMPKLDGREATKRLRGWANEPQASELRQKASALPVIALTAATSPGDQTQCFEAGMDDFLAKPTKLADLQRILQPFVRTR